MRARTEVAGQAGQRRAEVRAGGDTDPRDGVLAGLVGPIVWFVLTNRALNGYWRSLGAR